MRKINKYDVIVWSSNCTIMATSIFQYWMTGFIWPSIMLSLGSGISLAIYSAHNKKIKNPLKLKP